jgi:hypothetical protein
MPTIEVVSIDQSTPIDFSDLPFAVEAENKVQSHRSLFREFLDQFSGCIYHLGNPNLKHDREGRYFFAYDLLSRRCQDEFPASFLEFDSSYVPSIQGMFSQLLEASPAKKIVFVADWQFGPKNKTMGGEVSPGAFWTMHNNLELRVNSLYLVGDG